MPETDVQRGSLISGQDFKQPWPSWAKRAGARLLQILFPRIATKEWMASFEREDPFDAIGPMLEGGWFLGRLARCYAELKEKDPKTFGMFSESKWIRQIELVEGKLQVDYGKGTDGMILHQIEEVLQRPTGSQRKFWRSFAQGFNSEFCPRKQDAKAFRIYLILLLVWPTAQRCGSIREVYDLVFKFIPMEQCPPEVDPVDFDERQRKWFEKLCQRNLKFSLAKRGRPRRAQ